MAPKRNFTGALKDYGWSVYLDGLLLSAVFLCLENILSYKQPSFWALGFLYGIYFYWRECRDTLSMVVDRKEFNFLFLAAPMSMIALSFDTGTFSYLALIPTMVLMGLRVSASERLKSYLLIGSLIGVISVLALSRQSMDLTSIDVFLVLSLFVMNFGPMSVWHYQDDKGSEERLFLHDLTGEIHGLGLYIDAHKELDPKEMKAMVKSLGQMVRAHSEGHHGLDHRSLTKESSSASYAECVSELKLMLKSYLSRDNLRIEIKHDGLLESVGAWQHFHLPRADFRRLMLNIVKNISESGSDHIEFYFTGLASGLSFSVRNNLTGVSQASNDLEVKLGDVITGSSRDSGMGLVSMAQICERSGGHFHFSFEGHYWKSAGELCWLVAGIDDSSDESGPLAA